MHRIPSGRAGSYGRGVVNGGAGKNAEGFAAASGKAHQHAQGREDQRCHHVEEEDYGDGLRNLLVIGLDNGSSCSDGGAAADGGANAYKSRDFCGHAHPVMHSPSNQKRGSNGADDNGQGLHAGLQNNG